MVQLTASHPVIFHDYADIPDDGTDVTDDLQAFIDSVPDGLEGTPSVIDLGGASFHCEGTLKFLNREHLTFTNGAIYATAKGPYTLKGGTPIFQNPDGSYYFVNSNDKHVPVGNPQSYRYHIHIHGCTNVTFEAIHVEGVNVKDQADKPGYPQYLPNYCFEHAFHIDASTGTTIENCSVLNVFGDWVDIGADNPDDERSMDTVIDGCDFQRSGRQGVSITRANNTTVVNSGLLKSARAGEDIEPETTASDVHGVTIRFNVIDSGNDPLAAAGAGQATDVDFSDNTILHEGAMPVVISRPDATIRNANIKIERNDATTDHRASSDRFAFEVYNCDGVSVADNRVFLQPDIQHGGSHKMSEQGNCVLLANCTGGSIADNEFQNGNPNVGIDVSTSPDTVVSGNTFPVVPV